MIRTIFCVILLTVGLSSELALAQSASNFQVFPVVANGRASDGGSWQSTFMIANASSSAPAACALVFYGMPADLFDAAGTKLTPSTTNPRTGYPIALLKSEATLLRTSGTGSLGTGYATIFCLGSITANVIYSYYDPGGNKFSEATVFGAQRGLITQLMVDQRNGAQMGLALANDSDAAAQFAIAAFDLSGDPSKAVGAAIVTVPARTTVLKFLYEVIPAAGANYTGYLFIASPTGGYSIGLRFTGGLFTTVPAIPR